MHSISRTAYNAQGCRARASTRQFNDTIGRHRVSSDTRSRLFDELVGEQEAPLEKVMLRNGRNAAGR